ncbi:MAG: diphthine--ammonia ligase [Chlamydiae bacterium]|nr:diphthine--ammonia ligase [Chlamydiota bacterium]MBI3265638.1 diphthine--ammonia ligase [Chlamydiota bacterium]
MMREPILMCWSGGKDSSLALQVILQDPQFQVVALLTTVTEDYERISMHGVRVSLLQAQAEGLHLPVEQVRIPPKASNQIYEEAMTQVLNRYRSQGVSRVVFGDLFLEDIRRYREERLAKIHMEGIFPLWLKDTKKLAQDFIQMGFRAILVCTDPKQIPSSFCGREFDQALLQDFPKDVDPCGEKGEFHTFVYDGPIFKQPIPIKKGERVQRDGFWFCDLDFEKNSLPLELANVKL